MKENEQQFTDIVRRNRSTIYTVWHRTNVDSHNSHEHMVINRNRLSSHCHKCRYWHVVCVLWWWHRSLHWCSCCMVDIPKDAKDQWRNDKADWGNQQRINNPLFHHRNNNIQQATLHSGVACFFLYHPRYIFPKNLGSYEEKSYICRRKAALGKLKTSFLCARLHFLCPKIRMPSVRRPN